jgi:hypothetical protein
MDLCKNCGEDVHTPDDRTGLIHTDGKYSCHRKDENGKIKRLSTVAE